jgi:hypothetical protein
MLKVKFISGGYIGMVEEYFISKLKKTKNLFWREECLKLR